MGPRLHGATLAMLCAGAAGSISCQVVFGLDGYALRDEGGEGGAGGAGDGGASTGQGGGSSSAGGGGGAPACPPLAPAVGGGSGVCRVRHLDALATPATERSPGAYCVNGKCGVYFQQGNGGVIACATCNDLASGDCGATGAVAGIPGSALSPYLRTVPSQLWLSYILPTDDDYDVGFAPIVGDCAAGAFAIALPSGADPVAISSPDHEFYPAISPNGRTLFFTRCEASASGFGPCRVLVAHRSTDSGPFEEVKKVPGLHAGAPPESMDIQAQPVWADLEDSVEALHFASTRAAPSPTADAGELDLFVARRPAGSAWDAPFEPAELVDQLSSPESDLAPFPLDDTTWLWSRSLGGDSDLYVVDVGCAPSFGPLDPSPFTALTTPSDERGPALAADGALLFTREIAPGEAMVMRAGGTASAWAAASPLVDPPLDHPAGARDQDPFGLADGGVVFASDRTTPGEPRLWIAAPGSVPVRITGEPSATESGPFVAADGALWLSWGGGSDTAAVIARALPDGGGGWLAPAEVTGLGHETGRGDRSPRLSADLRTLLFVSTRSGGFAPESHAAGAPSVPTIWAATRPSADAAWDAPFPLPELGSVNGAVDPWPTPDTCGITVASRGRRTAFGWDLKSAARAPAPP